MYAPNIRPYRGYYPQIHSSCYIDPMAVIMGDVVIDEGSSVFASCVIRSDVSIVRIGKRTNIQDGSVLHHSGKHQRNTGRDSPLIIGDDVTVGHGAILHGCRIADRVLIGMGSIILDDAIIPEDTMIGANSLVGISKTLESGFLYLGSPAKKIRPLSGEEIEYLRFSAENYVQVSSEHKRSLNLRM